MSTTANNWADRKAALKQEIVSYFWATSNDKEIEVIVKACAHIKNWGTIYAEMVSEGISQTLDRATANSDEVKEAFSRPHRGKIANWINRYAELTLEALNHLESQRTWKQGCWARDDFELEDWESTQPRGEIQVCVDRIRVLSYDYIDGFAASLPKKGKKSIGKYDVSDSGWEWNYPLSELDTVKEKTQFPVIYAIDAEHLKQG